tara:strand:+ start:268 stop:405 length:138 start_codon:yes stop_codon:yes gene_type:complete
VFATAKLGFEQAQDEQIAIVEKISKIPKETKETAKVLFLLDKLII